MTYMTLRNRYDFTKLLAGTSGYACLRRRSSSRRKWWCEAVTLPDKNVFVKHFLKQAIVVPPML